MFTNVKEDNYHNRPEWEFTTVVYALPKYDYEIMGRVIARYKTRKNFWQRWEVVK